MDFCSDSDKRRFPRVSVEDMHASIDGSDCKLHVLDLNLDGLALATEGMAGLARDQVRSLRIWRGESEILRIDKARVAHCDMLKTGFQFLDLDPERRNLLFSLVIGALSRALD